MNTEQAAELEAFRAFVDHELGNGTSCSTVDELVAKFRDYQQDLDRFRKETESALEESARGESKPLDVDALKDRVVERLAEEGVTD